MGKFDLFRPGRQINCAQCKPTQHLRSSRPQTEFSHVPAASSKKSGLDIDSGVSGHLHCGN